MFKLSARCEPIEKAGIGKLKTPDGNKVVGRQIKLTVALFDLEAIENLLGLPIGLASRLFDDQQSPYSVLEIAPKCRIFTVTGDLHGSKASERLPLEDAWLSHIKLTLVDGGALMRCRITWDRSDDVRKTIETLYEQTVTLDVTVTDAEEASAIEEQRKRSRLEDDVNAWLEKAKGLPPRGRKPPDGPDQPQPGGAP